MPDNLGSGSAADLRESALSYIKTASGKADPQQKIALAGAVLTLIGVFLPFTVLHLPEGLGGSFSFLQTGLPGVLTILAAIVLGAIGLMPAPSRILNLVGFGAATLVLGMLLSSSTASALGPAGMAAAGADTAGIIGRGIGAYVLWVGALVLEYAFVQRAMASL